VADDERGMSRCQSIAFGLPTSPGGRCSVTALTLSAGSENVVETVTSGWLAAAAFAGFVATLKSEIPRFALAGAARASGMVRTAARIASRETAL
jgi:hypothetical protein